MKTNEEMQEAIELTPEQEKAWRSLERAIKKCKKENIYFYQVLESLGGLNGNNVRTIACDSDMPILYSNKFFDDNRNLNGYLYFPFICTSCSFADDSHFVILKGEI